MAFPWSLLLTFAPAALREKIAPDEAEDEGCGGPTVESDNEVWRDFRRNPGPPLRSMTEWKPKGWGQFSSFRCRKSLEDSRYSSLLAPKTEKNWLPAPPAGKLIAGSKEKPHENRTVELRRREERLLLIVAHGQFRGDGFEVAKETACAPVSASSEIQLGGG